VNSGFVEIMADDDCQKFIFVDYLFGHGLVFSLLVH
jgi:hypothetical protein